MPLKKLLRIAKEYNVKVYVTKLPNNREGCALPHLNKIWISSKIVNKNDYIFSFFHELQHCLNFKNGKYIKYHDRAVRKRVEWSKATIKVGLKAERYTDKEAYKLLKKYFPKIKIETLPYSNKDNALAFKYFEVVRSKLYLRKKGISW